MSTVAYKCINCGGPLEFNPAKQMFSCEYCRSDFTEKELKVPRQSLCAQPQDAAQPLRRGAAAGYDRTVLRRGARGAQ